MGVGRESHCVGRVYGADSDVQKTVRCNSKSNAPDDGHMYLKHVEPRIHQYNYLVASSWHFTLFHEEDARSDESQVHFLLNRVLHMHYEITGYRISSLKICRIYLERTNSATDLVSFN